MSATSQVHSEYVHSMACASSMGHQATLHVPHALGAYFRRGHRPQKAPWQQNPVSAVDKGKVTFTLRRGRALQTSNATFPLGRTWGGGQPLGTACHLHVCLPLPTSHHSLQLQSLHAEGKQGLSGPHVQESGLLSQGQCQEVLDARLGEPPCHCGQLCRDKAGVSTAVDVQPSWGSRHPPAPPESAFLYTMFSWA